MSDGASLQVDPALVEAIAGRLEQLRAQIRERTDRQVRVVCVTKGHPVEVAAAALAAGASDLGESYAQELLPKAALLGAHVAAGPTVPTAGPTAPAAPTAPTWHFIGRLQSNKVRQLAGTVGWWHTVDRPSLATEIARRAPGARVLVQLDLAGLPGRGGCTPEQAPELVRACTGAGLEVVGLMGVGVPGPAELSRAPFARLVAMADDLGVPERSIGMSGDWDVALDEGATILRIGAALVGPRPSAGAPPPASG